MFPADYKLKRFHLQALLWSWLLLKSRCDDAWTGDGTSEIGVLGAPDIEVATITITTTIAWNPDGGAGDSTDTPDNDNNQGSSLYSSSTETNNEPASTSPGTLLSFDTTTASPSVEATSSSQPTVVEPTSQVTSGKSTEPKGTSDTTKKTSMSSSSVSASPSGAPGSSMSSVAIGAITGSISGAIILAAFLFLCFRHYKRKKQDEAHVSIELNKQQHDARHSRRLIPSAIDTTGFRSPRDFDGQPRGAAKHGHGSGQRGDDLSIGIATDGTGLVPTTPALESGGRPLTGLHARVKSTSSPDRDSLYFKLLDEVRAGPVGATASSQDAYTGATAASSAVQWRDPVTPASASSGAPFSFDFTRRNSSSSGVSNPAPVARAEGSLGERAWHRRKVSSTFQPPSSRPPSMPLPPTPPARSQRSIDAVMLSSMPASNPSGRPSENGGGDKRGGHRPTGSGTFSLFPNSMYALGGSANSSMRALGPSPAPTPPPKDSPTLQLLPSSRYEGPVDKGKGIGKKVSEGGETTSPTLPPISQDEKFDFGLLRSAAHTRTGGERDPDGREEQEQGREERPVSLSTIGTSILFPDDEEHRAW
ncbi:hypothetical protein F4804DRAFT_338026 [Jackrogersella minutella]|nr:hypothetical protein F4804DRAFT_338026 [Jackrogersella minutella]